MAFANLSLLFAEAVTDKDVLLFRNSKEVEAPHFYICIRKTDNDVLFMVMSTTQRDRLFRHLANNGLDAHTVVTIQPFDEHPDSPMNKRCWINCNDVYSYTVDEIALLHKNRNITAIGKLPQEYFEQIVNGICLSPLVTEEIKEELQLPPQ
jgi:hypothetical protein